MLKTKFALVLVCASAWLTVADASNMLLRVPFIKAPNETKQTTLSPFDAKMREAFDKINKKDLAGARTLLNQAVKLKPASVDAQLALAELERLSNQPKAIESALQRAIDLEPKNPDVLAAWARWYFANGDFKTTEAYLHRAIDAKPDSARPYVDLGDLYLNTLHDNNQAVTAYRKALVLDPKSAGAHAGLGSALLAQSNFQEAISEFEHASKLAPGNALPMLALGRIHASQRRYKEADQYFSKALALEPKREDILIERADAMQLDQRFDASATVYREAIRINSKNVQTQIKLGMALQRAGKTNDAFKAYQDALKLAPNSPLVFNNMAVLGLETKTRLAEVGEWSRQAVELAPDVPNYLDTRALALQADGKTSEAIALLESVIPKLTPSALLNYRLGLLLEDAHRELMAVAAFRQALLIDPGFESARDAGLRITRLSAKP